MAESKFYSLRAAFPGDKTFDFADLKGKTVLIVNTASRWYALGHSAGVRFITGTVASLLNIRAYRRSMTSTRTEISLSLGSRAIKYDL